MPRGLKIALYSLGGVFAVVLLFALSFCLYLRTESGSRFLLGQIRRQLEKTGGKLEYAQGRIDPFATIHFENLHVIQVAPEKTTDFTARTLDAKYGLHFLPVKLTFETFQIVDSNLVVREKVAANPTPPVGGESALKKNRRYVISPPAQLELKEIKIVNFNVDYDSQGPNSSLQLSLKDLNATAAMSLLKREFLFAGEAGFSPTSRINLVSENGDSTQQIGFSYFGKGKGSFRIYHDKDVWKYELAPTEATYGLGGLDFRTKSKDGEQKVRVAKLSTKSKGKFVAKTRELFELDPDALETLEIDNRLTLGRGSSEQRQGKTRAEWSFVSAESEWNANLKDKLNSHASVRVKDIFNRDVFLRPANLDVRADSTIPRSFADIVGNGEVALNLAPLVRAKWNVGAKEKGVNVAVEGDLSPADDIAKTLKSGAGLAGFAGVKFNLGAQVSGDSNVNSLTEAADIARAGHRGKIALDASRPNRRKPASVGDIWPVHFESHYDWSAEKHELGVDGNLSLQRKPQVSFKGDTTFKMAVPEGGLLTKDGDLSAQGKLEIAPLAVGDSVAGLSVTPVNFRHSIELKHGKFLADVSAAIERIEMAKVGRASQTKLTAVATSPDLSAAKDIDVKMDLKQGDVEVFGPKAPPRLAGLTAALRATVRDNDRFALESFTADFNRGMAKMTADATGKVKAQDFQMRGSFIADIPTDFPEVADQKFSGRIDFPWTLSVSRGTDIIFLGEMGLKDVAWAKGVNRVSGVVGKVPVSEKIVREGAHVKFAHLITQNPFERVDYERLRPLIHGSEQVRIERIGMEEKNYGPFVGFFSLRQNMMFVHQFDLTLGKSGLAYGEMYLDMHPDNLQMGFLTRLTQLNLVEVLPKRLLPQVPEEEKSVSGRAGLVVNLNRATVDGRMDITEIGPSQLITLINVLDPQYEDERMNMSRAALGVGYPSFVEIAFQKGYVDLGVDLVVLGLSRRYFIRGVPISKLVANATSDLVKKSQEGPLK